MGPGQTVSSHHVPVTEYSYKIWTGFLKQLLEDFGKWIVAGRWGRSAFNPANKPKLRVRLPFPLQYPPAWSSAAWHPEVGTGGNRERLRESPLVLGGGVGHASQDLQGVGNSPVVVAAAVFFTICHKQGCKHHGAMVVVTVTLVTMGW